MIVKIGEQGTVGHAIFCVSRSLSPILSRGVTGSEVLVGSFEHEAGFGWCLRGSAWE